MFSLLLKPLVFAHCNLNSLGSIIQMVWIIVLRLFGFKVIFFWLNPQNLLN